MGIDELLEFKRALIEEIAMMPLGDRSAFYNGRISGLPLNAQRLIRTSIGAHELATARPPGDQINVVCQPGSTTNIKPMTKNNQTISGGTFNAPVGVNQAFSNCYNTANSAPVPEVGKVLLELVGQVEKLHPQLDQGSQSKAERKLKLLTDEATQEQPDKDQLALSGKGLIEAATTCAAMAGPVVTCVKAVLALFGIPSI